ncbi:ATP-binding protein [Flavitalea sp. BT771]|uniref:sensor histidine kinase n=1 Tax=Flavitalea sp. BT771 TaxID=3063329 RepID=UPI0026E362DC|nr:ATP-binding protein [Flavitalea sp. BT771]MDO6434276.1 ATP-binding protein [Flavitalea sp. BT771]MDV6223176.1 ATP-binding protein [Flavitalea sp. BT771]
MNLFGKRRLAIATTVYWVLLAYIIAGLGWWFIALQTQNRQMATYKLQELKLDDPAYESRLNAINAEADRKTAGYIGEGSTFLLLILVGALFVYREVRRQIRLQLQQQYFMMAVTHELKTPIAVTKLNLETLQKHRLDEQKQQKIIQAALQETGRLDNLANNILIASQLEGGGYTRSKEDLDLSSLVQRIVHDLRHRYADRKWEDVIEPGCSLAGDPLLLQMLVSNLAENAIKYSPKEGVISILLRKQKDHILLQVKDEGPGIPEEEKKKIFDKFYRTGREQTRTAQGTGLGLYLCRKIALDHKATIKVTDNSPVGSIFTVSF